MAKNPLLQSARKVASGVIWTLAQQAHLPASSIEDAQRLQAEFIAFCELHSTEHRDWRSAWQAFAAQYQPPTSAIPQPSLSPNALGDSPSPLDILSQFGFTPKQAVTSAPAQPTQTVAVATAEEPEDNWCWGKPIYAYTRKQALADGFQVDVSEVAREAGFTAPVFMNRTVWSKYVEVPRGVRCQDEKGRLWDILWMLRHGMRSANGDTLKFKLHVRNDNRDRTPPLVTLKAVAGPKDIDEPDLAITIMLPDED